MRKCLLLLLSLYSLALVAQQGSTKYTSLVIKQLPPEGILLDKGWQFQPGDNMLWAKPDYNDTGWPPVDPTADIHDLVSLRKAEIGWFRLRLKIDSGLLNQSLALLIRQRGASEIYLNGKLLHKLGVVSTDDKQEVLFNATNTPYSFLLSEGTNYVLAVRYSFTTSNAYINYTNFIRNPCLVIRLQKMDSAIAQFAFGRDMGSFFAFAKVGFMLFLGLLHLFFYLSYRIHRINLYYSLFAFSFFIVYLFNYFIIYIPLKGQSFFIIEGFAFVAEVFAVLWALMAVYAHADEKRRIQFWLVSACMLLTLPAARWPYHYGWFLFPIYYLFAAFDAMRVSRLAEKKEKKGSMVIFYGWLGFAILMLPFDLLLSGILPETPIQAYLGEFFYNSAILFVTLPLSILLARQYANTNRSLEAKLIEVQHLSARTIAQEHEKQQILASQKQILEQQVEARTADLNHSLTALKATQQQLIQREKMASLGELTAGIAHEIQNPLNFINNFAAINTELLEELQIEAHEGNMREVIAIASDVKGNEQKIVHHGGRADSIVKSMLQHAQVGSGVKQLTDVNRLADEYLKLSYQGARTKDKLFSALLRTNLDNNIREISIVPQDMGQVMLNLFNNAFYAVAERKRAVNGSYEPVVSVSTKLEGEQAVITVKDNGTGIPQKVLDKIFQPFFTTKPTGEGTGLGLSLSYDIITKGHSGQLSVQSTEGEGSEFIIQLPIS